MTTPDDERANGFPGTGGVHDNPDLWLPRLGRILDDQIELYRKLTALSERQTASIETGDTDALLTLLGQRQGLVERVTRLNEDLEPFTNRWQELSSRLPESSRSQVRERLDTLEELVSTIARRDERDRAVLESRRDRVSAELKTAGQQRGAINAYADQQRQAHIPRYQDRQG